MVEATVKRHLRLVARGTCFTKSPPSPPSPPAASTILLEIDIGGRLQKLEVNLRKEDALQALQGLLMAHMRAIDLLLS